jgi:hypothetical protein
LASRQALASPANGLVCRSTSDGIETHELAGHRTFQVSRLFGCRETALPDHHVDKRCGDEAKQDDCDQSIAEKSHPASRLDR